jgi:hypothetical protein
MLVEKSEDIIGPDSGSKVTERMAVLRGVPIAGIDLQFVRFSRILHHCGENLARRQVKIVLGLEKENWRVCISNRKLLPQGKCALC